MHEQREYDVIRRSLLLVCCCLWAGSAALAAVDKVWIPGWTTTAPMMGNRAGMAALEAGGFIYVIGGIDGVRFLNTAEFSRIGERGDLGEWRATSSLKTARGFFAAVAHDGYIYAAGGGNGPNGHHLLASVERAAIRDDGSLAPWSMEEHGLAYPRRCVKLAVVGNYIYAFGGFSGVLQDTIERAAIEKDGHLGRWTLMDRRFTMPRYVNALKSAATGIYAIGGHDQNGAAGESSVEWAAYTHDHGLGPWRRTKPLANPRYGLAASQHQGYIYALGGLQGAAYSDSVEKAMLDAKLGLRPWQPTTALSSPRANFAVIQHDGWIYVLGGTNRSGYYDSVEAATFNDKGDIGYWASTAEARHIREIEKNKPSASGPPLVNFGKVTTVIHTGPYTYLNVATDSGEQWFAAPHLDVKTGDAVGLSRGVTMLDFFSRSLQRRFEEITFVEHAEKMASP